MRVAYYIHVSEFTCNMDIYFSHMKNQSKNHRILNMLILHLYNVPKQHVFYFKYCNSGEKTPPKLFSYFLCRQFAMCQNLQGKKYTMLTNLQFNLRSIGRLEVTNVSFLDHLGIIFVLLTSHFTIIHHQLRFSMPQQLLIINYDFGCHNNYQSSTTILDHLGISCISLTKYHNKLWLLCPM